MDLTAIHEDYLEAIYHLNDKDNAGVRTTDLADRLGCRLPTVTRTVRKIAKMGYLEHESRGLIHFTPVGRRTAAHIAHRHTDTVQFLTEILGLDEKQAEADACQIEHGLSAIAAQRLHEFLEYIESLTESERKTIARFARESSIEVIDFTHLPSGKTAGWRG